MQQHEPGYYERATGEKDWESGVRRRLLDMMIAAVPVDASVLEVGCGIGAVLRYLPEGFSYAGTEVSAYALEEARARWEGRDRVRFTLAPAETLPFPDASFDAVYSVYVIEHLAKPREAIREFLRVLRPGGTLLLVAPNLEFPLAYPNALRHRSGAYRVLFLLLRIGDYLRRLVGGTPFRTIDRNFTQATGKYEKPDDDLVYVASTDEVVRFLRRAGADIMHVDRYAGDTRDRLGGVRGLMTRLPGLRYYGPPLFIVATKRGSA